MSVPWSPTRMLEAMGEKVITEMDRLAVAGFDAALNEMTEFHEFLIDAHLTEDASGEKVSFAQIGDWHPEHAEWIRHYRRLFERAAEFIGRENEFITSLAYVPARLLRAQGRRAASDTTTAILDLANILVHRLEAWLTRRRDYETPDADGAPAAERIAGSNARAYEDVIVSVVGAWESILESTPRLYEWREENADSAEEWRRFQDSWPFLQRHLQNTAYMLAVAVWNEDEIATRYYSEMLVRWSDSMEFRLARRYGRRPTFLTTDVMTYDWDDAVKAMTGEENWPQWDTPQPKAVFFAVLQHVRDDVLMIAGGLVFAWYIEDRQNADLAVRVTNTLINGEAAEDGRSRPPIALKTIIERFTRISACSGGREGGGYGGWLDELVRSLDSMTERRVVPGRVYRPSTRHSRDDLQLAWLAHMIAKTPNEGDGGAARAIARLAERESAFAEKDRGIRRLTTKLNRLRSTLSDENRAHLAKGAAALAPNAPLDARIETLDRVIKDAVDQIESLRLERLKDRPADARKLEEIRTRIDTGLLSGDHVEIFEDFTVRTGDAGTTVKQFTFLNEMKGYFTDPEMEDLPSDYQEFISKNVLNFSARHIWQDFFSRKRRIIKVDDEDAFQQALLNESASIEGAGAGPILLVRRWGDPPWLGEWFDQSNAPPNGLRITRRDGRPRDYIGSINEIDVYSANLEENQSLLFRADILTDIRYGSVVNGRVSEVTFIPEDEQKGRLVVKFAQHTEWRDEAIIVFRYKGAKDS